MQNPQKPSRVLIIDDDSVFQMATKLAFKGIYEIRSAYNGDEALAILRNQAVEIVLLDIQMRTPDEGLKLIPKIRDLDPDLPIIMTSGMTDYESVREAMRLGASDYVGKSLEQEELLHAVQRQLENQKLKTRNQQKDFQARLEHKTHRLVGNSPSILALRKVIDKARASSFNVVITGETGTGKEVVARQLRKTLEDGTLEPFVAVDSATIQSTTAESQLFGHEKGAFTGADKSTKGIFEEASGGIVYFDEVANMPLSIQSKLLRVLQEKEVTRLGSNKPIPLDFRVVCATNRNLEEMVSKGEFKDDLLQRISVIPISIEPLRKRQEDIPELLAHFSKKHGRPDLKWSDDAIQCVRTYTWPGNVRELGNLVAFVITMAESNEIEISDLPPKFREGLRGSPAVENGTHGKSLYEQVADFEKQVLGRELESSQGNISRMALKLGMDRSHLYTKLKEHGLQSSRSAQKKSE
ncbi:MAG: sigma-54-dependent Fis family transcriptional regulator [Bdellovibrionales bacterium]|nr:sigma-54-dependent Fis family transcriptional regulator [Bdellovibrionales bacterium]